MNRSYYAVIQVGDINFRVALDTGSADLWLMSSRCSTKTCSAVPRYPLTYNSPSFVSVNSNSTAFTAQFTDGTSVYPVLSSVLNCRLTLLFSGASGFIARETVKFSNLTLANQAFG